MISGKAVGCQRGPERGRHFIRCDRRVGRKSGEEIGGQRDESSAPADGIYHARQKQKRAYNYKRLYRQFHDYIYSFRILRTAGCAAVCGRSYRSACNGIKFHVDYTGNRRQNQCKYRRNRKITADVCIHNYFPVW